jgi:hypothetical protein
VRRTIARCRSRGARLVVAEGLRYHRAVVPRQSRARERRPARRALRRAIAFGVSGTLLFACTAQARAESPDSTPDPAIAETLFQRGRERMDAGKLDLACKDFAESLRLDPKLGTLLNLATCHERQGKTATSWAEFMRAETLARRAGLDKRQRYAKKHAEALRKRLTRLVLAVPKGSEPPRILLDGTPLGKAVWNSPVPVDPGGHTLTVLVDGTERWRTELRAPEGPATVRLAIPAEAIADQPGDRAASGAPLPSDADTDASEGGMNTLTGVGIAALGVGVVGLTIGGIFGGRTLSLKSESEGHCVGTVCDAEGVDLVDRAFDAATVSTVSLALGGGFAALGVVLVALGVTSEDEQGAGGAATSNVELRGAPGGLQLRGRW